MAKLGIWLQRWRSAARLTQRQAASRSGVPQHTISRLENDEMDNPGMEQIVRLASSYGISPNEVARLMGWWVPPPSSKPEDYRWEYVARKLTELPDRGRDDVMQTAYDRALFWEMMAEPAGEDNRGT